MENYYSNQQTETYGKRALDGNLARQFMQQVYVTMGIGLLITGMTAYYVSQSEALMQALFGGFQAYIVMFAPLAIVWFLAARVHKMSFTNASIAFGVYSLVNGLSFATIFWAYELGTISKVFFITAGTFGAMALIGVTTKIDLSKYRSIMMMALVGLIIAMVVNFFMNSSTFDYIISIVGVLLFSGLTAYDNQKLMEIGTHADPGSENTRKVALMGALNLYLDFINLFLFLLRIFGGGDD